MPTTSLEQTLRRLSMSFVVTDVMVPTESLVCAPREEEAQRESDEHSDFNIIPIKPRKKITGYYERDSGMTKAIAADDLIGDGTCLLDLLGVLAKRDFSFVLAHSGITGYVHFSDLNSHLVKLTLYTIIEELETHALAGLGSPIDEENLRRGLAKTPFKSIKYKYERAKAKEANRSIADFLNIEDILRLAVKTGKMRINEDMIKTITRVRNRVAHQVNPLVKRHQDVIDLDRTVRLIIELLRNP